jgi:hypothetical protein
MKSVIIDTSSAILLYKSGLIMHLVNKYQTLMTPSVYRELTEHGYPGSDTFRLLCKSGKIRLLDPPDSASDFLESYPKLPVLNQGERDTVHHQMMGTGDFSIIDDGRALRYCKRVGLPFINALLFPRILLLIQSISESEYHARSAEIIRFGWYTDHIIKIAANFPEPEIQPFLPSGN